MYLTEALNPESKPWLELGQKLGKVAANLAGAKITKVMVTTNGAALKTAGRFLSAAVTAGMLPQGDVNLVNAPVLAKDTGVEVGDGVCEFSINSLLSYCKLQTTVFDESIWSYMYMYKLLTTPLVLLLHLCIYELFGFLFVLIITALYLLL